MNKEKGFGILDALIPIAKAHGATVPQVALAWILANTAVTSVIIGARKIAQLDDNLKAVDVTLTADDMKALDEASKLTVSTRRGWIRSDRIAGPASVEYSTRVQSQPSPFDVVRTFRSAVCVSRPEGLHYTEKCRLHAGQQRLQQLRRVQRFDAGEVFDLLPARRARRDEHAARTHRPRGRQQLALTDLPRDFVVLPGVSKGSAIPQHPASRSTIVDPGMRASSARARRHQPHRLLMAVTVQQHGRRSVFRSRRRRPAFHSCSTYSSNSTHASPTIRALRCASPRSRSGASSRTADRQLGSRNTIRSPCAAAANKRVDVRRGGGTRLFEQSL